MGIQLPNIEKYGDTIQEMSVSINEFSKFYVVTVPKIMSSTMGLRATEQGWGFQEYSVDISTHKMTPIGPTRGHQKTPNVNKRFEDDWNSLIAGRSSSKDIIILYRNPISKFITGLFEDTAITTFNSLKDGTPNIVGNDDISGLIRSLLKTSGLYTKNEITRFFKISYKKDTLFARHIDDQTRINELLDYKKYKNMYNEIKTLSKNIYTYTVKKKKKKEEAVHNI